MTNSEIRVMFQFSISEGNTPAVKEVLRKLIEVARDEKGMLRYEWFFNDDETEVFVHEWYADPAAVYAHRKACGETLKKLRESATATRVDAFGTIPDDLRDVLKPFNPTIAGYWDGFAK